MKNGSESATSGESGPLVDLTGLDFLTLELECTQCDWRGEAGDMPLRADAQPEVTLFTCPECATKLARHTGPFPDEAWALD